MSQAAAPARQRPYCRRQSTHQVSATNRILVGDARSVLRTLPADSVDCVITSPPYFLLRSYGSDRNQIGMEASVEAWVRRIIDVCDELARVLTPQGSLWLNLGDSYSRHPRYGAPAKGLLLAPERVLLRLAESGWTVRNKVVWAKTNPMPHSVLDRLSCSWEPLYLLVRSERYHFDLDAIRVPQRSHSRPRGRSSRSAKYADPTRPWAGPLAGKQDGLDRAHAEGRSGHPSGRKNPGDVWSLATARFSGAHFATFPTALVERPLLASCPQRVCLTCARAWEQRGDTVVPTCGCAPRWRRGLVLDPFLGAGTVALVAQRLGRDWLGIELNPEFAELAQQRLHSDRLSRAPPESST